MSRESDDGFVCASCGETVYKGECGCGTVHRIDDDESWDKAEDEAEAIERQNRAFYEELA